MDITVQIIATGHNHDLSYSLAKQARRYRRGDIVAIYHRSEVTEAPNINTKLGFIHITNIPDTIVFATLQERLTKGIYNEVDLNRLHFRRKKWRFIIPDLAPARKTEFLDTHETSITWTAFKNRLKRKVIINSNDPSQDDESNALIDSDVI